MNPDELREILDKHNLFILTKGENGERANLQNAYMFKAILPKVNLIRANLPEAILSEADLSMANITGANLLNADLTKSNLSKAIFIEAALPGAKLTYADIHEADFSRADMTQCSLSWSNISGAKLERAILKEALLINANLSNCNLKGADLSEANFSGSDLSGADLSGAILWNTELKNCKLGNANFAYVRIDRNTKEKLPDFIISQFEHTFNIFGNSYENIIVRSIEFPEEYHMAGISILNYFGSVLRKKYPNQKAKIRIEQNDLKVIMVIEPTAGDPEIIERALDEYGLMVTGKIPIEEYTDDKLLALEFDLKLKAAYNEIETKKKLLEYSDEQNKKREICIDKLLSIIFEFTHKPIELKQSLLINNSPEFKSLTVAKSDVTVQQAYTLIQNIPNISRSLNELINELQKDSKDTDKLIFLKKEIENIPKDSSQDEIKHSPSVNKLRKFIDELGDDNSQIGKAIKGAKRGIEIAQGIAGYYNDIAQWCGLPQVPRPFLKKK